MPPQEHTALLSHTSIDQEGLTSFASFSSSSENTPFWKQKKFLGGAALIAVAAACVVWHVESSGSGGSSSTAAQKKAWANATGPYKIVNVHEGKKFFDGFSFYKGADSLGSAGYLTYKSAKDSFDMNLANVTNEKTNNPFDPSAPETSHDFVYMSSAPTEEGPRDSVRLEGNTRYDRGLFILDLRHLPTGCGVWPAFWLTDEDVWPDHGEIDVRTKQREQKNDVVVVVVDSHKSLIPLFLSFSCRLLKVSIPRPRSKLPCTRQISVTCLPTFLPGA